MIIELEAKEEREERESREVQCGSFLSLSLYYI
jgi:hypothetical protein